MTETTFRPDSFAIGTAETTGYRDPKPGSTRAVPIMRVKEARKPRALGSDEGRRKRAAKYPLYDLAVGESFMYVIQPDEMQAAGSAQDAINKRRSRILVSAKNQGLKVKVRRAINPANEDCLIVTRVENTE